MLLKRLEVYGFKSFADKLDIEFDRGISAIVGPNGSGKSNVTDAIRWVLGEQNLRNLRGAKVEDIIFAGSSTRKPLNMAEVSVVLDNSDRRLGLDFEEIMITRRIFRSGESEFYINKVKCRLKDIYNLLADTGLGKNSFSVISQNKVDEVLNTKPEDRRYLFEECAGITKYRDRKKEAIRKLEQTKANIVRLHDIISEIETQLEPLKTQADKTREYNIVHKEYQDCTLTQILYQYEDMDRKSHELQAHLDSYNAELFKLESTVNVSEADKIVKKTELTNTEKELAKLGSHKQKIHDEIERTRNQTILLEERIKASMADSARLSQKKQDTQEELTIVQQNRAEIMKKVTITSQTADRFTKILQEKKDRLLKQEQLIREKEEELRAKQQQDMALKAHQQEVQQDILLLQRDLSDLEAQLEQQAKRHSAIMEQRLDKNSQQELIGEELLNLRQKRIESETNIVQQQSQIADIGDKLSQKQVLLTKMQQDISTANEKAIIYKQMQESYEGFGKAVKQILQSQTDFSKNICGAVAELINMPSKYIMAIEVALGNAMQNIVTKDTTTAKEAIAYLKQHKLGRVTFMPLTTVQFHQGKRLDIPKGSYGFIDYADELVEIAPEYRVITNSLLGRILVVDTLDNALQLAKLHDYRLRIVTLEGELLQPGGSLTGGMMHRETGFLHRAQELTQIQDYLLKARDKMLALKRECDNFEANYTGLQDNLVVLQSQLQTIEIELTKKEMEEQQLEQWFAEQDNLLESMALQQKACELKRLSLMDEMATKKQELKLRQEKMASGEEKYSAIIAEISNLQLELKKFNNEILRAQINATEASQEVISYNQQAKLLQEQIVRIEQNLEDTTKDLARQEDVINSSTNELQELKKSLASILQLQDATLADYSRMYKRQLGLRSELSDMDEARSLIQGQVNQLKDKIHRAELSLTKVDTEIQQTQKEVWDKFQVTMQEAFVHRLEMEPRDLKRRLEELTAQLATIGTINPNAIVEYEALAERHSFMHNQITDLDKAKLDLSLIIEQIDATMSKQFTVAFAEIKLHFDRIFKRLFGGGYAKIYLTDTDNVLQSGIEIEVEPPDKKLQSLSVLSGGERTLTVIALLFAFFSYNPAPFSVLDEIDAPLDEANIHRFANFLKDYAQDTQFILVTHRKGTMEAADVMYGITIEDAGVSKLLSVKLEEYA